MALTQAKKKGRKKRLLIVPTLSFVKGDGHGLVVPLVGPRAHPPPARNTTSIFSFRSHKSPTLRTTKLAHAPPSVGRTSGGSGREGENR